MPPAVAVVASRVRVEERLIFEALERRGRPYAQIDDRRLVFAAGEPAPPYAVVINRSISQTRRRYASRLFEAAGIPVLNGSRLIETCDDKVVTTLALAGSGIPVPATAIALSPDAGREALEHVGYPAVLKPVNGSWGRLLARVSGVEAAEVVLEQKAALGSLSHRVVYAQEYVDKPGRDIRAIVIGDRVVAATYRWSSHWITNAALSGRSTPCPVTPELEQLCLRTATAVGGGALAVDLLESPSAGLLVNEVNSTMEFHSLFEATGADVAGCLVDHALTLARAD